MTFVDFWDLLWITSRMSCIQCYLFKFWFYVFVVFVFRYEILNICSWLMSVVHSELQLKEQFCGPKSTKIILELFKKDLMHGKVQALKRLLHKCQLKPNPFRVGFVPENFVVRFTQIRGSSITILFFLQFFLMHFNGHVVHSFHFPFFLST